MKFYSFLSIAVFLSVTNAIQLQSLAELFVNKLDEETKLSIKRAAAAALKVAVAAKKAEARESIKQDMKAVNKAEKTETSDEITSAVDRSAQEEERLAVERAVVHVEKIRQQKLVAHTAALRKIEAIKMAAKEEHDEINKKTQEDTQKAIAKAMSGVKPLAT